MYVLWRCGRRGHYHMDLDGRIFEVLPNGDRTEIGGPLKAELAEKMNREFWPSVVTKVERTGDLL